MTMAEAKRESWQRQREVVLSRRQLLFGKSNVPQQQGQPSMITILSGCLPEKGVECRACEDICPESVITFKPRLRGPALPTIETENCTTCGECAPVSPVNVISLPSSIEVKVSQV